MTLSAKPLVTRDALRPWQEAGLSRLAVSLDGVADPLGNFPQAKVLTVHAAAVYYLFI